MMCTILRPAKSSNTLPLHRLKTGMPHHRCKWMTTHAFSGLLSKAAIDSAQAAFESWQSVTPQNKAKIFKKAAELVVTEEYSKAITKFVIEETGCTPFWAQYVNVTLSKDFLEEAGDLAYAVKGEILPSDNGAQSFVFKRPMGVM